MFVAAAVLATPVCADSVLQLYGKKIKHAK
jgi:hypothetical protein